MGNATSAIETSGDCHGTAARRQNNRDVFGAGVSAFRQELSGDGCPAPIPIREASMRARPRVVVRKRPLFEHEAAQDFDVLSCQGGTDVWGEGDAAALWVTRAMLAADHRTMYCEHHGFYADAVFGEAASTAEVYNAVLGGPLQHGSTTVLCFGQTGSGKTFTLAGIIDILREALPSGGGRWRVSALEVAGNAVTDLLHASARAADAAGEGGAEPSSSGVPCLLVGSAAEAIDAIVDAARRRSTHRTGVHDASSRTHAVYQLEPVDSEGTGRGAGGRLCLTLVDLAGSEWARDQVSHERARRKEAQEVNASLSALKACLAARASGVRLPARDTALTRLLRGPLEGEGRMVLIATVSPSSADAEHALDTLSHVGLPGRASLMRGEVAGSVDVDRPLPPSPRDWTSAEVVRWWLATSTAAVERINAEVAEAAAAGLRVVLRGAEWPPRTKLGLSFEPPGLADAPPTAPPTLSRVTPRTPIADASPLIRRGTRLVGCRLALAQEEGAPPEGARSDAGESLTAGIDHRAGASDAPPGRSGLLAELRRGSLALTRVADALDAAESEATRAAEAPRCLRPFACPADYAEEVPRKLDDDAALLRAWVVGGEAAQEEERRRIARRTEEEVEAEAAGRAASVAVARARLDEARAVLARAAAAARQVELEITFEPAAFGRAEVPRVPRHFSGASRLGQGDGKAFMNAFADPERGLRSLIVACEGDTRVAETLFQALCALAGTTPRTAD
ncbi:hypothetical protein EMIHUDRAFT_247573 [Emiliania huxleyi CCMP1516]|uniref:Kinesin motor domain-containing protein n=2 Tax=Emiliania huxleyi TaxID=2903 RepID=A0A0D3ILT9_EMIH1|nr:hypothetical protein EMIHUDRAFT_247573 [Emiliania huxleyi CCMP1516]EOD12224.1 hypothetical protein EMIHUDRAFT_247573 [Emiliania huxleyi CCMP1516]|eukprot:XP_005764653.1 hypothetical protein EMIHUDRAFT_247573 [Emiliania huxleyi CCMP1516]